MLLNIYQKIMLPSNTKNNVFQRYIKIMIPKNNMYRKNISKIIGIDSMEKILTINKSDN